MDSILGHERSMSAAFQSQIPLLNTRTDVSAIAESNVEAFLKSTIFRQLLESKRFFDVIIVESVWLTSLIGLGNHFNAPVISISPGWESREFYGLTATPSLRSFMPIMVNSYTDKMSFWQRLQNQLTQHLLFFMHILEMPRKQTIYEKMFYISNSAKFYQLHQSVALIIINSDSASDAPRPLMPHIIEVGGLAIQSNDSHILPNEIQTFLDDAEFEVIYFTFGSEIDLTSMASSSVQSILYLFREMSNIKFLVKGDDDLKALTHNISNVLVRSWLPQKAILQHPNMKCFITHGGHNSIHESIYYGKPVIAIPFKFDQLLNARWAQEKGFGIELQQSQITRPVLKSAVESILYNSRFVI